MEVDSNFKLDWALINVCLFFFDNPNFEKKNKEKKIGKITQIYATKTIFSQFLGQKRKH
jgi:hypothetical protein